ncbi:hypothetical protein EJV47_06000 [Hymenobacter gummosus]|uniref:Uncharacterized protein n=1 Tax=Hymenobacter gummosus TaxID=1776032 RepID=A0A3S0IRB4_9BACT|nr:hypothetical protein [Hymenobacter gummosus]RTQ52562.1 hypothetical protein EJV47_06000 [Hymenobacter gummosus]
MLLKYSLGLVCGALLLGACQKESEAPAPDITIVSQPARLAPLEMVNFRFTVQAAAELGSIAIRHVVQNATVTKKEGFTTPTSDDLTFSHDTGMESVGKTLRYEIQAVDANNRQATKTLEIPVDSSQLTLQVLLPGGQNALAAGVATPVRSVLTSTTLLMNLHVKRVLRNQQEETVDYFNNLQLRTPKLYDHTLTLTPDANVAAYKFMAEDWAGKRKTIVLPVQ